MTYGLLSRYLWYFFSFWNLTAPVLVYYIKIYEYIKRVPRIFLENLMTEFSFFVWIITLIYLFMLYFVHCTHLTGSFARSPCTNHLWCDCNTTYWLILAATLWVAHNWDFHLLKFLEGRQRLCHTQTQSLCVNEMFTLLKKNSISSLSWLAGLPAWW